MAWTCGRTKTLKTGWVARCCKRSRKNGHVKKPPQDVVITSLGEALHEVSMLVGIDFHFHGLSAGGTALTKAEGTDAYGCHPPTLCCAR